MPSLIIALFYQIISGLGDICGIFRLFYAATERYSTLDGEPELLSVRIFPQDNNAEAEWVSFDEKVVVFQVQVCCLKKVLVRL